jgi:hypothetical protein
MTVARYLLVCGSPWRLEHRMKKTHRVAAWALVFSMAAGGASAAVITFGSQSIDHLDQAGTKTEAGFKYTAFGVEWELQTSFAQSGAALATVFNGVPPLAGSRVDIVSSTAAQFVFSSIDWKTTVTFNANDVVVEGFLGASLVGSLSLTGENTSFQTATGFGGPIDLLRIRVTNGSGSAMIFDNVVLNAPAAVPEPATLALAGLALAGLGAARRVRRSSR